MAGTEIDLPASTDLRGWSEKHKALMSFAGLAKIQENGNVFLPDRGVAEAFIAVCRATGLNPFAKQIYAMEVKGKLSIVVGVDGFRIIAQRTGQYLGQTPVEWTRDGVTWVTAWLPELLGGAKGDKPAAARVGIRRRGFSEPLYQVVTWAEFGMEKRFTGDNWDVRPAHMLGIRAETHALRKAFPNDLSGIYTPEDLSAESDGAPDRTKELLAKIEQVDDRQELTRMFYEHDSIGMTDAVRAAFMARGGALTVRDQDRAAAEAPLEGEIVPEPEADPGTGEVPPPAEAPEEEPAADNRRDDAPRPQVTFSGPSDEDAPPLYDDETPPEQIPATNRPGEALRRAREQEARERAAREARA
jgi:phage recombination protein Bet